MKVAGGCDYLIAWSRSGLGQIWLLSSWPEEEAAGQQQTICRKTGQTVEESLSTVASFGPPDQQTARQAEGALLLLVKRRQHLQLTGFRE